MPLKLPRQHLIYVKDIPKNERAISHLGRLLFAFPEEETKIREIIKPLVELPEKKGDLVVINHWQAGYKPWNRSAHLHSLVFKKSKQYTRDDETKITLNGTNKIKDISPNGRTSDFREGMNWLSLSLLPTSTNDSFLIEQDSQKTFGKMSELEQKHPVLYGVLSGIREQLESLPTLAEWYPKYVQRKTNEVIEKHNAKSKRKLPFV
jgi:hypothetical protein